jgi:ubiquinone/menaquinone biosynthesis C-methylase UbiE
VGSHDHDQAALLVERSIRKYRRSHRRYDRKHPEIFNSIEQDRLRAELERALVEVRSAGSPPRALDLGCGTGNITRHLLELGARVLAADVSPEFLTTIGDRYATTGRVETIQLNGQDLSGIPDASIDLVCAYSVLHHIPDYLGTIDEIARVLSPGGVAFLDHEANHNFWDKQSCFWEMLRATEHARIARRNRWNGRDLWNPQARRWQRFLAPSSYVLKVRRIMNPAYPFDVEGDIHVWDHDHVEWDRVEERLMAGGCEIVRRGDYLNYSTDYPDEVWARFRDSCTNMRLVVARRQSDAPGGASL